MPSTPPDAGRSLVLDAPLPLDGGGALPGATVAYETWGALNAEKSNAILICHALTGDQFLADAHPLTGKPGWWTHMVGPGKPVDTDRFFVVCANVLGGCMGATGPASIDPETGAPYGLSFPVITIADMVRAQAALVDALGIDTLFAVIGGSMGGMQALQWTASYPDRVFAAAPIATAARHTPQNIAFHEVGRQAVMADPDWRGGRYAEEGAAPKKGLAVARMAAHVTYLSETALNRKFGRLLQDRDALAVGPSPRQSGSNKAPTPFDGRAGGFDADFQVESYLRHQGMTFVDRFDANSYLYITRAMDYFDLAEAAGGRLADAFRETRTRFLLASFTSDWLYPTVENRAVVRALHAAGADVSFVEIESDKGHDAFLLDEPELSGVLAGFLDSAATARGLSRRSTP